MKQLLKLWQPWMAWAAAGGLLFFGLLLRFWAVVALPPWMDEGFTLAGVRALEAGVAVPHSAFFGLMSAVSGMFGDSFVALRLPGLFVSMLLLVAVPAFCWKYFGPVSGLLAIVLVGFSPWAVLHGANARAYGMVALLLFVGCVAAWQAGRGRGRPLGGWVVAGGCFASAVMLHPVALGGVGGSLAGVGLARLQKGGGWLLAAAALLFVLGFGLRGGVIENLGEHLATALFLLHRQGALVLLAALGAVALLYQKKWRPLGLMMISAALGCLLATLGAQHPAARYLFPLFPLLSLLAAAAPLLISPPRGRPLFAAAAALFLALGGAVHAGLPPTNTEDSPPLAGHYRFFIPRADIPAAAEHLRQQLPQEALFFAASPTLWHISGLTPAGGIGTSLGEPNPSAAQVSVADYRRVMFDFSLSDADFHARTASARQVAVAMTSHEFRRLSPSLKAYLAQQFRQTELLPNVLLFTRGVSVVSINESRR